MIFGAIPVKKVSTRFPGKNFMAINGVPLINLAIARLAPYVDRIIISTDAPDDVRAMVMLLDTPQYRCMNPENKPIEIIDRSADVRDGELPSNTPVTDALRRMDLTWGRDDLIVMTQVTSPLIRPQTVGLCICYLQQGCLVDTPKLDMVVTVNPDFRPNGGVYCCRAPHLMKQCCFWQGNVFLQQVPFKEGIDINYPYELTIAQAIANGRIS